MNDALPARIPATAILLAGGESRRMGRDKARLPWGDVTLIEHVHRQLSEHFEEVILASGTAERYVELGLMGMPDAAGIPGPMAGVIAGLRAARLSLCYLHPCDAPTVEPNAVRALLAALEDDLDAATPSGNFPEPLGALYRRLPALQAFEDAAANGEFALRAGLVRLRVVSCAEVPPPANLNTPEDLRSHPPAG